MEKMARKGRQGIEDEKKNDLSILVCPMTCDLCFGSRHTPTQINTMLHTRMS